MLSYNQYNRCNDKKQSVIHNGGAIAIAVYLATTLRTQPSQSSLNEKLKINMSSNLAILYKYRMPSWLASHKAFLGWWW